MITSPIALRSAKHTGDCKTDPLPGRIFNPLFPDTSINAVLVLIEQRTGVPETACVAGLRGLELANVISKIVLQIETAFAGLFQQRADAFHVSSDGFLLTHADQIVALAAHMPYQRFTILPHRQFRSG
jgi:hypothetical protein